MLIAIKRITMDGVRYNPGNILPVKMPKGETARLLKLKAVERIQETAKEPKGGAEKGSDEKASAKADGESDTDMPDINPDLVPDAKTD